jgi:hypothetical protein
MKNTVSKFYFLLLCNCFNFVFIQGQNHLMQEFNAKNNPLSDLKPNVKKLGPYFGLEQGKNIYIEAGGEFMYKRIRLKNRILFGSNIGISYGFVPKSLCIDGGVWWKIGRLGFTYGATVGTASNFDVFQFRLAPTIGFKLGLIHFKTGFYLYPGSQSIFQRNTLYLSARVTLVKHRDFDWR